MRLLILAALLSVPACAEWQTLFATPNGDRTEKSVAKPLSYFTTVLRGDWGVDIGPKRTQNEGLRVNRTNNVKVHLIGKLAGFLVYDVYRYYPGDHGGDVIGSKSIVVKIAPGLFHEVYYRERPQADSIINPSFLVKAGANQLLGSRDFAGGNHGVFMEEYFWLDANGPARVDFAPLQAALQSTLPQGFEFVNDSFDNPLFFPALKLQAQVINRSSSPCCDYGNLEVTFTMNRDKITVTGKSFRKE
jgi:hypothetical protein